ncbi:AraC family transcriptional regulator [Scatolibacter rhodanostii]|uniref:AraC family transcriptional regulator n=1 Tax=Scatolibacter rhodanostii TaxID=2014781 RepID=UPI001356546F|nr:AraC family transcriptional regulator [Scatolibacter rhodanostii]
MANQSTNERPPEYDQPIEGGLSELTGTKELVGYLPGTSVRIWYTHLEESFSTHWHNALEILVGENGYYESIINDITYHVRAGEILLIPPGMTHTLTPKDNCNGFVYLLNLDILEAIQSSASVMPILTQPIYITETNNPKLHALAHTLLRQMREKYFSDDEMLELLFYSYFLNLVAEIGRYYSASVQSDLHLRLDKRKEYVNKFNEIINYINKNYTEDLTLEGVSKEFGFSKYHFSRLFKQYTQFTFCDYLMYQRVKSAEYNLAQANMSITEIAFQSGFSSLSTFSRVFRNQKNCTPSEYRELYSNKHKRAHKSSQ